MCSRRSVGTCSTPSAPATSPLWIQHSASLVVASVWIDSWPATQSTRRWGSPAASSARNAAAPARQRSSSPAFGSAPLLRHHRRCAVIDVPLPVESPSEHVAGRQRSAPARSPGRARRSGRGAARRQRRPTPHSGWGAPTRRRRAVRSARRAPHAAHRAPRGSPPSPRCYGSRTARSREALDAAPVRRLAAAPAEQEEDPQGDRRAGSPKGRGMRPTGAHVGTLVLHRARVRNKIDLA